MHPGIFFGLFPPFPIREEVFVAIAFAPEFRSRIDNVIIPAVKAVGLTPRIVNATTISDSITTRISQGISQSRLVFADISTLTAGVRNANVMYEVGMAHAVRRPEEVILFRTDNDRLPFDVSTIIVNRYDPDNDAPTAIELVAEAFKNSLSEFDLTKSMAVQDAIGRLDLESITALAHVRHHQLSDFTRQVGEHRVLPIPMKFTVGRLLDLGLIRLAAAGGIGSDVKYQISEKGEAVCAVLSRSLEIPVNWDGYKQWRSLLAANGFARYKSWSKK